MITRDDLLNIVDSRGQLSEPRSVSMSRHYSSRMEYLEQVIADACREGTDPEYWSDAQYETSDAAAAITAMLKAHADGVDPAECIKRFKDGMDKDIRRYAHERVDGIPTYELTALERKYHV